MGWGVYKSPDGMYVVWSTIVTDFIWFNCTAEEIAEVWREEFGTSGMLSLERAMSIANGERRHPLGRTFESCLSSRDEQHGLRNERDNLPDDGENRAYVVWLETMRHYLDHEKLYRHVADPTAPIGDERAQIKERLFQCHYGPIGFACGWTPTAEQQAHRERIDTEWLASKSEEEVERIMKFREVLG